MRYSKVDSSVWGAFFLSFASFVLPPRKKNFSPLFSLFKQVTEKKALQKKRKKEKRYACHDDDDSDDDAKFSSHSLATKIARRKFLFAARLLAHSFFVVLLLLFGLLSSHNFSHFLARRWKDLRARGARKWGDFFIRTFARKKRGWCFGGRRERVDADFEL